MYVLFQTERWAGKSDSEHAGEAVVNTAEAHECHSEETGYDEGYGSSLDTSGDVHHLELFADACEEGQGEAEADGCAYSIDNSGNQVRFESLGVVCALCHEDGNAEDAAIGGDERQEYAESLIERWRHLLQDNLHHLHECSDDKDEGDGLEIYQVVGLKQFLYEIGYDGGYGEHEGYRSTHAKRSVNLL